MVSVTRLALTVLSLVSLHAEAYELKFDPALPQRVKEQIQGDIAFVATGLKGSNPSLRHLKIFGDISGGDYLIFFTNRIEHVKYAGDRGPIPIAYVDARSPRRTMWITDNFLKHKIPQIFRIAVLWHEARHAEEDGDHWMHSLCPEPYLDEKGEDIKSAMSGVKLAGVPACDATSLGSYGITATMMGNIKKRCLACSKKVKEDAELLFQDALKRHPHPDVKEEILKDLGRKK